MMRLIGIFAAAVCTLVMQSAVAQDDGINGHGFHAVAQDGDPRDLLGVQRAGRFQAGEFFTTALFEFTGESVTEVMLPADGSPAMYSPRLSNVLGLHLGFGAAVHDFVRLDVTAPVFMLSNGRNGQAQGGALGDTRFSVNTAIIRSQKGDGFGISAIPFVDLPTGSSRKFLGQGSVGGGLKLAMGYELSRLTLSMDLGVDLNGPRDVSNLSNPHQFLAGFGAGFLVNDDIGINAEFIMAQQLSSASIGDTPKGTESPMQAALSVRGKTQSGAHWLAGGMTRLSRGIGAASFRIFVGGGFGKIKEDVVQVSNADDLDNDGVPNEADKCPEDAENYNDYKDDDGCPDALSTVYLRATNYDKPVEDISIAITGAGGTIMATSTLQPVEITDLRPGIYDIRAFSANYEGNLQTRLKGGENRVDLEIYPTEPGTLNIVAVDDQNAPVPNAVATIAAPGGGDGIQIDLGAEGAGSVELAPGGYTLYIQAPGFGIYRQDVGITSGANVLLNAIMGAPRAQVSEKAIEINEKVFFALNSADIENRSHALLSEIASLLQRNPDIRLVEVAGHTSTDGGTEHNRDLSISRARSVVQFLSTLGVADFRLKPVGYGESKLLNPADPESSENRRVEFVIIKRGK